jgi:hypothetical protein
VRGDRKLPRRDLVPVWAAGGGFYGAFCCAILAAQARHLAVALLAAGAVAFAGRGIWRWLAVRRDPSAGVHRELLSVLRAVPGERICRDERVVYTCQVKGWLPLVRTVTVIRVPEDDVLAIRGEGGADLVVHTWQVTPWEYGITAGMHGTHVTGDDLEKGVIDFGRPGFWQWQKHQRAARKAGMLHAPPDEVRTLIGALRDSEPLTPQDGS